MAQSWKSRFWRLRLVNAVAMGGVIATITSTGNPTLAQIKPDTTLGTEGSVVRSNIIKGLPGDQLDGGARRGVNLFHSFEEFDVNQGRGAYFTNPTGVENILSRVTGGDRSDILGTLGVLGNANLFLINSNGIIFGPNASLDVNGSFVATTANAVQFGNQGFFNASAANAPPLLTVNPSAFLFNQMDTQSITVNSRRVIGFDESLGIPLPIYEGLKVPDGKSLLVLGGDVRLEGGIVLAPGGHIELGGAAGAGTIGLNVDGNNLSLNFPEAVQRADVSLNNDADVNARTDDGGSIAINAQNLNLTAGSSVRTGIESGLGSVDSKARDIEIDATGAISIADGSFISNAVLPGAVGQGGDINITARSLALTNQAFVVTSILFGQGNAGSITITVGETVSVINGAQVGTATLGQGDAGSIKITAGEAVSFDGGSFASSSVGPEAVGNAGDINVTTGSLSVTNGAQLSTNTFGQGDAGNVNISARDTVSLDGVGKGSPSDMSGNEFNSAAISRVDPGAVGSGGDINITAGSLFVTNGAQLTAEAIGRGNAGNVNITTRDTVSFDGVGSNGFPSAAFSDVLEQAVGRGGSVNITTGALSVTNGAQLSTSNDGIGAAGNLEVSAGSILLDNQAVFSSDTKGGQGNIFLNSQNLILRHGSDITTDAQGTATGGNITIDTDVLAALENSDITANAAVQGGQVSINAQGIFGTEFRDQPTLASDITASSELGPQFSGIVEINTPDVDPSEGVVTLPDVPVNVEVAQGCQASSNQASVEFFNTGRGGLAPSPYEPLSSSDIWEDVPQGIDNLTSAHTADSSASPDKIVEAQGWLINEKGEATLVAEMPTTRSQHHCRLR